MQKRPKPNLKKSLAEKLFDLFTILFTLGVLLYLLKEWSSLPESVPIHFNVVGEPDGWGSRWMITLPIIIGFIMWVGLHILEKYPQSYNYLFLTEENAQRQYRNAQLLMHVMKNSILLFFSYMAFDMVSIALGENSSFGIWTTILFLSVVFGIIAFFIYRSIRIK